MLVHFVGDRFSKTEDTADVTRITGLPVLAKIPKGSGLELVEAFRVLRTNLMVLEGAGKPRTLAVVSSNQSAGKTFTAVHLAQSAAGLDEKVVIVDADLRKPSVHERLGVPRAPGLSAVLQGNDLATMLRKLPDTPFLRVLTSGAPVQDASAVLGARPFRHVLDSLRAVRLVVVDTPPASDVRRRDGGRLPVRRDDLRARREDIPPPPGAPDARSTRAGRRQPRRRRGEPHRVPAPLVVLLRLVAPQSARRRFERRRRHPSFVPRDGHAARGLAVGGGSSLRFPVSGSGGPRIQPFVFRVWWIEQSQARFHQAAGPSLA